MLTRVAFDPPQSLSEEGQRIVAAVTQWTETLNKAGALNIEGALVENCVFTTSSTTPVPTSGSGTFTTVSSALTITKIGNCRFFDCTVTITTNGTAATSVVVALPEAAATSIGGGGYNAANGQSLSWQVSGSNLTIRKYDGLYPGADGVVLQVSGHYRV